MTASRIHIWRERKRAVMGFRNLGPFGSFTEEGWEKAYFVAKFFCFLHVTNSYLVTPVQTFGPRMLPAIDLTVNVFFAERISSRFGKVTHGDIVVLRSPQNPRMFITKHLVGIEGDSVTYISSPENSDKRKTVVVPKGHIGYREITCIIPMIQEILVLFLMDLFRARYSGEYGDLKILDLSGKTDLKHSVM